MHVGESAEHACETIAYLLAAHVALADGLRSALVSKTQSSAMKVMRKSTSWRFQPSANASRSLIDIVIGSSVCMPRSRRVCGESSHVQSWGDADALVLLLKINGDATTESTRTVMTGLDSSKQVGPSLDPERAQCCASMSVPPNR